MKYYPFFFLLLLSVVLGCGKGHVHLKGKVVFADDGSPVVCGTVLFASPTFQSRGTIDPNGNFAIGSYDKADGLPPGTYEVAVIGAFVDLDPSGFKIHDLVDPKWTSPATSGLKVDVDKTTKFLEVKVDRNPVPMPK